MIDYNYIFFRRQQQNYRPFQYRTPQWLGRGSRQWVFDRDSIKYGFGGGGVLINPEALRATLHSPCKLVTFPEGQVNPFTTLWWNIDPLTRTTLCHREGQPYSLPVVSTRCPCLGSMLGQRLRRWPSIEPMQGHPPCWVSVIIWVFDEGEPLGRWLPRGQDPPKPGAQVTKPFRK